MASVFKKKKINNPITTTVCFLFFNDCHKVKTTCVNQGLVRV